MNNFLDIVKLWIFQFKLINNINLSIYLCLLMKENINNVGEFILLEKIGYGAFGDVFMA